MCYLGGMRVHGQFYSILFMTIILIEKKSFVLKKIQSFKTKYVEFLLFNNNVESKYNI